MEEVDLRGEAGQVGRLLERRVAAADDRDLLVAEEEAVARRAGRHAAAAEPRSRSRGRATAPTRPVATMTASARYSTPRAQTPERPRREVDPLDVDVVDPAAEPLGLLAELRHQLRPEDPLREARVVLDVARDHQLAARDDAGEDDRVEVGPRGVDRGGQAGGPGADDQELGPGRVAIVRARSVAARMAGPRLGRGRRGVEDDRGAERDRAAEDLPAAGRDRARAGAPEPFDPLPPSGTASTAPPPKSIVSPAKGSAFGASGAEGALSSGWSGVRSSLIDTDRSTGSILPWGIVRPPNVGPHVWCLRDESRAPMSRPSGTVVGRLSTNPAAHRCQATARDTSGGHRAVSDRLGFA